MAVESKPIFYPEVIRQQVRAFNLPERVAPGFSRVCQGRAGLAAAQFPPGPTANGPMLGEHRQQFGRNCLLTPSVRSGKKEPH